LRIYCDRHPEAVASVKILQVENPTHPARQAGTLLRIADVEIDLLTRCVKRGDRQLALPPRGISAAGVPGAQPGGQDRDDRARGRQGQGALS